MLKYFKIRKISWKLTVFYAFLFTLMLTALDAGTLLGVRFFLIAQARAQVQSSSKVVLKIIESDKDADLPDLSDSKLLSEAAANPEIDIKIARKNGEIINSSGKFKVEDLSASDHLGKVKVFEFRSKHLVLKNNRIIVRGKTIAYFQVVYNMQREYDFIKILFILMAFADLIGMFVSILAGYLLSRRILKPIDSITREAKSISIHNLRSRIAVGPANDELSRLAVTINKMIERMQQSYEKQIRFVSDASHELRTPISIIKGYISLIDEWGKNDKNVLDESIAAIRNEADGMTLLIERLLFLARGDSGTFILQREDFDLTAVVNEVVYESRMISPEHHISAKTDESLPIYADRKLIKQALRALVDNGIKFTPRGGTIEINASAGETGITVAVSDTGIGIAPGDIPHIFDRFYRADKARSKENGGSGLGLSIVKWIAEIHGGTVALKSVPGEGTAVILHLSDPRDGAAGELPRHNLS